MSNNIKKYLSEIGRKGGLKSRRKLDPATAKAMVKIRMAKMAYRKYHGQCFWSFDPELKITISDVRWVGEQLLKNGSMKEWELGKKLCQ